jgi:myo-inositol-1(or 4)-monophosphatase
MKRSEYKNALASAVQAARLAGKRIRANLFSTKKVDSATQHDIKLALDVQCQEMIGRALHKAFPEIALLGEEGSSGDTGAPRRWVVDPIDGTVNFTYGIPHACVSIALQERGENPGPDAYEDGFETVAGVVYDPFCDELWTAAGDGPAKLNGRVIRVSSRSKLNEAIVSVGFAKTRENLKSTLPLFNRLVHRVRKLRMMGSAALALTYVAGGRFDLYLESGIRLWDIAAGGFILERAGGEFWRQPAASGEEYAYRMIASNGLLRRKLT